MSQFVTILTAAGSICVELPPPDDEAVDGVAWGLAEAFPTPAYWRFQVLSLRLEGRAPNYKLGRTLREEVGACLLGGHGIPAAVGIAAYERLREHGAFDGRHEHTDLLRWLSEPLNVNGRTVRYRFAAQKARYLSQALPRIDTAWDVRSGRLLRDRLVQLPGVGMKTASWIARNWLDANDVAILDVHLLRVGQAIGLFPPDWTPQSRYLDLEARFLSLCKAIDVAASELDAVIWREMASSTRTVRRLIDHLASVSLQPAPRPQRQPKREAPVVISAL